MGEADSARTIVAGVQSGQVEGVVGVATLIAKHFGASVVCVAVDPALLSAGARRDSSEIIEPIDPDTADAEPQQLPDRDVAVIHDLAAARSVRVEILIRVGDPSRALTAVAEQRDAGMIVVGSQTGRRRVAEFFNASVAARLTHQQHRPVVVVPHAPVGFESALPWDAS
ncbi:universal stress family protein [Curtobacterium sp. MCBA15_016]|uniref:universal stress protein n=1 Tax=Curtobacterium sp. MCBA15_016 TaxID=1898740 RepID=UPI0008DC99FD|nr:universal stress protein [Curtobacterium sp. MCBA15_016]OII24239.1 universal stress family protein [Curtobacterium sp. MCBA15_016]